jgi:predicted transcriptional regulator
MEKSTAVQRGRPATPGRVGLHARVEIEIRDELSAMARANDRSLAAEIRRAIHNHVTTETKERA